MKTLLMIILCLAAPLLAGGAQASCVYNRTPHPLNVNLHCGAFCRNTWTIHVGEHKCRQGKGGTVWVRVMDAFDENEIDDHECELKVDDHGWVSVQQSGRHVKVISKHKNGSVRDTCTMHISKD